MKYLVMAGSKCTVTLMIAPLFFPTKDTKVCKTWVVGPQVG